MITPEHFNKDILRRFPSHDLDKQMDEHEFQTLLNKLVNNFHI